MSDSFESWWEINHRSLPVHDPKELARVMYRTASEAKRSEENCRQIIDTYARQEDDLIAAHKELTQLRAYAESAHKELAQRDERILELTREVDEVKEWANDIASQVDGG